MKLSRLKQRGFLFSIFLLFASFSLMSFHPKNNFRIEKRHYRKGYYVDIWSHPKTYPQRTATPPVAAQTQRVEETAPVPVQTNGSTQQSQRPNTQQNQGTDTQQNSGTDAQQNSNPPSSAEPQQNVSPVNPPTINGGNPASSGNAPDDNGKSIQINSAPVHAPSHGRSAAPTSTKRVLVPAPVPNN